MLVHNILFDGKTRLFDLKNQFERNLYKFIALKNIKEFFFYLYPLHRFWPSPKP